MSKSFERWYVVDARTEMPISQGYLTEGEAQALALSMTEANPELLAKVVLM